MQMQRNTGIGWRKRRLNGKLHMDRSVKIQLDQETQKEEEEEDLDKNAVCHRFYSTCTARTLPRKLLKVSEGSNVRKCTSHSEMRR